MSRKKSASHFTHLLFRTEAPGLHLFAPRCRPPSHSFRYANSPSFDTRDALEAVPLKSFSESNLYYHFTVHGQVLDSRVARLAAAALLHSLCIRCITHPSRAGQSPPTSSLGSSPDTTFVGKPDHKQN